MVAQFLPAILGAGKSAAGALGGGLLAGGQNTLKGVGQAAIQDLVQGLLGGGGGTSIGAINSPQVRSEVPSLAELQQQFNVGGQIGRRFG